MSRVSLLVPLFPILLLAGCLNPGPAEETGEEPRAECIDLHVPLPSGGSHVLFNVSGSLYPFHMIPLLADWGASNDGDYQSAPIDLPPGSTVEAVVANDTHLRLDQFGAMREVQRIGYWLHDARIPRPMQAWDESFDVETGNVVEAQNRAREANDLVRYSIRPTIQRPGFFGASLLWGRVLEANQSWEEPLPNELPNPAVVPSVGRLIVTVSSLGHGEQGCIASVRVSAAWGTTDGLRAVAGFHYDLEMEEGQPWPVSVASEYISPDQAEVIHAFDMSRERVSEGNGRPITRYEHLATGVPQVASGPSHEGFPDDRSCAWSSCLAEALDRIALDPQAIVYRQSHPDARPLFLSHRMANASSYYSDIWDFEWADGRSELHASVIHSKTAFVPDSVTVYTTTDGKPPAPPLSPNMTTLDAMAALFESAFGKPPETLLCGFAERFCGVNTHLGGSDAYFLGEAVDPGLGYRVGIMFALETGRIHQIDSSDPAYLPPELPPLFL